MDAESRLEFTIATEGIDEGRFRQIMAVLGVRGAVLEQPIETLSHGQQKKLDLARSFLSEAGLLLWDEPLNFIDIDAPEQIEDVLLRSADVDLHRARRDFRRHHGDEGVSLEPV